jgi:hypothetical protein
MCKKGTRGGLLLLAEKGKVSFLEADKLIQKIIRIATEI